MNTIFDPSSREELIRRIQSLNEQSTALWGKMNVCQMAKHCTIWDAWVQGTTPHVYRQEFLGRLFGKMSLPRYVRDDRPIGKGMPAGKGFVVKEVPGDLELQKQLWTEGVAGYAHFSNPAFIHDFFGKMTPEEIGIFAYKHADHHLRQFNA